MIDFNKKIKNSDKFRQSAIFFEKHNTYCLYPYGTTEYTKFWDRETDRCINGYTSDDGDWITGYNYFYLNYCPILRLIDEEYKDRFGNIKKRRVRDRAFPNFYDYDYYYFQYVQDCEDNNSHGAVLKARGKGYEQPYSELVATPHGFAQMGDLKIGDEVMNPDGNSTKVVEIFEQGYKDVFELSLDDGRKVRCGADHLWQVTNVTNKFKTEVLTTRDMYQKGLYNTYNGYNHYRYYLEPISEVVYTEKDYTIHPYILGALLGDGTINRKSIKISTIDDEIIDKFKTILGEDYDLIKDNSCCNYRIVYKKRFDKTITNKFHNGQYGVNPLRRYADALEINKTHKEKFIPNEYKYGSISQRYELVRGLMDTDGSITEEGSIEFTNTSKQLVEDLAEVLRSLGIRCEISVDKRSDKFAYRLYIRTNKLIFSLSRKVSRLNKTKKINSKVAIINIVKLDYQENSRCIMVSNNNHLYLTRDYIPTHNSFKGASMLCRNYFLIPGSKSYAVASENEFLTKDGLLSKAWEIMDFIDKHTAWAKKRLIDRTVHKKSGFQITDELGNKTEQGYLSEIIGISLKDKPDRIRGKRGKLILWEEAGMFKDILQAWQIARPGVEESGTAYGTMIAYGTGGSEGDDFEGLRELFYNPSGYNIHSVPNIWDENVADTKSGFFVPAWSNLTTIDDDGNRIYMDSDGNSLVNKTMEFIRSERQKVIDGATNNQAIDRYIAENPICPQEACLELSGNIFPKKELQQQLSLIRTNKKLQAHKQVGDLLWVNGELVWQQKKHGDITKYPLGKDDDPTGSIVIWEHPVKDPPIGLYIAGCDPYDHDQSGTNSLGSTFIYKRFQNFEEYYDIIVAEYTGRPATAEEYYENVRKLLIYYNARLLYENERKGIFPYFTQHHCDYLLADQPDIINDIIGNSKVQRRKGIHMTKQIRDYGEGLIKEWLNEEYAPGKKNLTKILSEPLLEELIKTNGVMNVDRVIALIMVMIYREQLHNLKVKEIKEEVKKQRVFDLPIFTDAWFNSDQVGDNTPVYTF